MKRALMLALSLTLALVAVGLSLASLRNDRAGAQSKPAALVLGLNCPPGDPMPSTSTLYGPSAADGPSTVEEAVERYLSVNGLDPAISSRFETASDRAVADLTGEQFMTLSEAGKTQAIAGLARDHDGSWRVVAFDSCLDFEQRYIAK